jgi:formate C-acetyltransferase
VESVWQQTLPHLDAHWRAIAENAPSPFGSVVMRGCVARATPVEAGGTDYNLVGINILGLGTLVDSLTAIEDVVFEQRLLSVEEMAATLDADFPDETVRRQLLTRPDRYGTDSARSNDLAREVSERLARMVLNSRLASSVQPYPSFFAFGADIYNVGEASPDGRRAQDLITYGVGPATSVRTTATTVLQSASHVAHDLCACGTPLAVTLNAADLKGDPGAERIRQLIATYFDLGGFHVHFNVTSAETLREAQADPIGHADLMVRVSGFSARFVAMDQRWQDALIERAEQGL